ncbi:LOW QUALITY PROTEIN: pleckstrin homology domain-containing family G member 3-like [Bombina bombina]|uniref:LOW QUALITY PROTEIN: pleckstrin homology domain-containing family G member 3-like n=1 Tax=Bombina bombina TaxID=8345 RepID=UPI00235A859E|nr:LOW QUALITY PROTEIN: pleckstrin homology domain-containing family G member 3-like [Bombina bombina]
MSLAADQHIPEMEVAVGNDDGCSLSSQTLGEELNSYTVRDKEPVFLLQDAEPQTTDESPRLSAASSSSTDKLSGTEYYDSDRPVSVLSTTSSSSYHEGCNFYESVNGGTREDKHFGNGFVRPEMELMASAAGSFHAVYREMQNGVKGSSTQTNSNTVNRRGRMGSRSLSPFGTKVSVITHKLNYVERVVMEILETERMYVQDLRSIVEDYLGGIIDKQELLPMKPEQVSALFGNIEDIYELNSELLQDLDNCKNDPVAVASCFVEKSQDFDIYTQYCTNYPNSVATLTECMRNKVLAKFFRDRQELLNHSLPLGSYLLKPVQRILKYHLLLQEIAKHFDMKEEGYEVVEEAIETMTGVAWYINDMKRKHEHAVRLQEIQSLLLNWKGLDLTTYGELVLEGTFRVQRARSERCFFLFDKALFITKKRGDHFIYKTHIPCSSLMLIESARDSLCFSVTHYKNSKQQHNLQAKTMEEKHLWTHHIKKLILENHHAIIPQKAKEAILEMDSIYSARYRYSPERLKKTMSAIEPGVTNRSGRRQSEPSKHILKQLGEKVGLKHAGSDGVLLEFGDTLQPSINDLATSPEQPQADEKKEQMANTELSTNSGAELSASEDEEDEEIHLGDDQTREMVPHDAPKGFKRQNSQCSGNAEKRRSVEVNSQEIVDEMEKENSEPNEMYGDQLVSSNEMLLAPSDPVEENHQVEEQVVPTNVQDPVDNVVTENIEELKTFSSEEDEEETTSHESDSILPPSVLDQASVIAERFINNMSRRSSLAIDDGKVVGYITPRLTSRSSSAISLDKIPYQNGPSDLLPQQDTGDAFETVTESSLNKMNSVSTENVFEERERQTCKRRESILSIQDRQLLDKIKTYYDNAEHQDAQFSIKRRESLTYIPAGLVRNSVFKINSLPRSETLQSCLSRQRMSSSSSNASNKNSRHSSWSDVPSVTIEREPELPSSQTQLPLAPAKNGTVEYNLPISDEEFKSPGEMIKVWDEIEKVSVWNEESMVQKSKKDEDVTSPKSEDIPPRTVENGFGTHEPLIILEDSDLSTIAEESPIPTPESTSPNQTVSHANKMSINEQDFKTPIRIHPKIMQLANCMNEDMSEKMKNKVYQLARQYSQRIKANKPIPHRQLREIEEDLRRGSLPSVEEEKQEEKGKLKPTLSLPAYDHIVLQEHSPTTPTSASFREKSPKRLSFSNSCDSPETASPVKSDCRSPLSPVNTEKFHWPEVRELRSRYIGSSITGKTLPVNRSHSVPDKMVEHEEKQNKANISHSHSMNVKCTESVNCKSTEMSPPNTKILVQVDQTSSPKLNIDLGTTLQSNRDSGQGLDSLYYISAEAPLENNKKVIVVEKVPLGKDIADYSTNDLENDDTFVHIRSPTTREKISIKAVIERCKAYQDSEEYRRREGSLKTEEGTTADLTHPESSQEQNLLQDGSQQTRVKNLREKFQS